MPNPVDLKSTNECNRKHRVIYYWLKAKFEAISEGLYEDTMIGFVREFYPNLLMGTKTILERTLPQLEKAFIEGKTDVSLMLTDQRKGDD